MKNLLNLAITLSSLLLVTVVTLLYSEGWRIDLRGQSGYPQPTVKKTGMLAVRSMPDGAKIYLDDELITATDDTISSLQPGQYTLRIERDGYESWEKEISVYPELVTDITAVLVLQSPRLEPLTNTNVKAFGLSTNQNNIVFLTTDHEEPGVWSLPLTGSPLNIFRNNTRLLIPDTSNATPSAGENIWWSKNDDELLVRMNETGYLLYKLDAAGNANPQPQAITNVQQVFDRWDEEYKADFVNAKIETIDSQQDMPEWIKEKALTSQTTWSPDEEKFFFLTPGTENPNEVKVNIYNGEDPLPVGEKRTYETLTLPDPTTTKIYWYSDSYHLILVEKTPNTADNYTISLVRIDGTNRTPIYTGTLASDQAFPTPAGDKIIVLTWLKERSQTNLYAISIR